MLRHGAVPLHQRALDRETCGGPGSVTIRPAELLPVGGDVHIAFLWCNRCLPSWQISHIPIDRPPWTVADWRKGDRFRCPGCHAAVSWHPWSDVATLTK